MMRHPLRFQVLTIYALLTLTFWSCTSETKPQGQEQQQSTVHARLPAEPDRLNPLLSTSTYGRVVNEQIFFNLLHFNPSTLELEPQLAKARPVVEEQEEGPYAGGVAYTFELQEAARWDNGTPITAADVAFTLKAVLNPKVESAHVRAYLDFIQDMQVDPDNPKRFTVYADQKYILGEAVVSNIPILPAYAYDPDGLLEGVTVAQLADQKQAAQLADSMPELQQFADRFNSPEVSREAGYIIGAGPYQFEEWATGQRIRLTRKEDWWGKGLEDEFPLLQAEPDEIVFHIIPDQTSSLAALKDEQVDVMAQIDAKSFVDLQDNEMVTSRYSLYSPASYIYYYVGMNNKNPKLADKRVRRALAHLVDVEELIGEYFYDLAQRTVGPFHPTKPYYHDGLKPIDFNPEKARALLAEAGWEDTDGDGIVDKEIDGIQTPMELEFMVSNASEFSKKQALLLQNSARQAGVKINIQPEDFTVLIDRTRARNYEMYNSAWAQDPVLDDPKQLWHSESDTPSGTNRVSFVNAEADRLIEEIRRTLDEERREQLYLQFQELIYEEQPYIFLFSPMQRIAISQKFETEPSVRRPGFFVNTFANRDAAPN